MRAPSSLPLCDQPAARIKAKKRKRYPAGSTCKQIRKKRQKRDSSQQRMIINSRNVGAAYDIRVIRGS
jgi:hypothetical protein